MHIFGKTDKATLLTYKILDVSAQNQGKSPSKALICS